MARNVRDVEWALESGTLELDTFSLSLSEPTAASLQETKSSININISMEAINRLMETEFATWFQTYILYPANNVTNEFLLSLAKGPLAEVSRYPGYYVNGYKFHTLSHGTSRATMNSGVCIKGDCYSSDNNGELDYYGRLLEVLELEYLGLPKKTVTLFQCDWFDPSRLGTSVHPQFKLVSINHTRRYNKYEPFVLAEQAIQVYYCAYPSTNRSKKDWWEACKIKARSKIEIPTVESSEVPLDDQPFQEDDFMTTLDPEITNDLVVHSRGELIDMDEDDEEEEDLPLSEEEDNIDDGYNDDEDD